MRQESSEHKNAHVRFLHEAISLCGNRTGGVERSLETKCRIENRVWDADVFVNNEAVREKRAQEVEIAPPVVGPKIAKGYLRSKPVENVNTRSRWCRARLDILSLYLHGWHLRDAPHRIKIAFLLRFGASCAPFAVKIVFRTSLGGKVENAALQLAQNAVVGLERLPYNGVGRRLENGELFYGFGTLDVQVIEVFLPVLLPKNRGLV